MLIQFLEWPIQGYLKNETQNLNLLTPLRYAESMWWLALKFQIVY